MAPAKILEVRITGCLFSDSHFYRLAVDGHDTELCSVSTTAPKFNKVLHVQVADGNSSMELGVFAMVDGSEKQMAMGTIPVTFGKDFVHHDLTIPTARGNTVTGIIKVAFKQIKLNVVYFLRESVSNKSVLGISINTALVGDGADSTTEYKDVRIKVRDKEGTILGNNKVSNEKPEKTAAFFPLEENEVLSNENTLELVITLEGENENAGNSFQVPIAYGAMTVSVPMASNLALLVTVQLLFQPARLAGLVHEVSMAVLKETGANDKISKFKGNDYATLTRNNVLHLQFMNPDDSTDVSFSEDAILKGVHGAPFDRKDLQSLTDGFFVISPEGQNGRSSKKKPLLKKNLILHMGTFSASPQLVADPSSKLRCKCSMVAINTEVLGATDGTLSSNARHNLVMGNGVLEEKEREVSRETGVISVVLEGALVVTSAEQPLLNALSKAGTYLSARVTLSIVPTESPPLFSPTGELMPLSPPESPRLDDNEEGGESKHLGEGSTSVPKLEMASLSQAPSNEALRPGGSSQLLMGGNMPNGADGELPGQWSMQNADQRQRLLYGGNDIENWGSPDGLGENYSPSKYKIDRASTALVAMIKSELTEKQTTIDRLLDEASKRTDAIELCGREIRSLREEALSLQQKLRDSDAALKQRDADIAEGARYVEESLGAPEPLSKLSRSTLIHVAVDLGERLQAALAEKEELKNLVSEAKAARMKFEEDQKTLAELQDAHVEQSRLIQKLQKKLSATDTYKATIKLQERVIAKMQAVIEAHLRTTRPDGGAEAAGMLNRLLQDLERQGQEEEMSLAQAQVEELERGRRKVAEDELRKEKAENDKLKKQVKQLEYDLNKAIESKRDEPSNLSESDANRRIDVLEAELTAKEFRVSALEEQLTLQAQDSAHEIARLRTKLFEHEMDAMLRGPVEGIPDEFPDLSIVPSQVPSGSAAQAVKALNAAAAAGGGATGGGVAAGGGDAAGGGAVAGDLVAADGAAGDKPPDAKESPEPEGNPEETGGS